MQNRVRPLGGALTIGPGITLRGRAGVLGNTGESFDNQGTVRAEVSNQTITLTGDAWTSSGLIDAVADGNLTLQGNGWSSTGTISIAGGGNLALNGSWVNQGAVTMDASNVFLGGDFTLMTLGSFTRSGGTVFLTGNLQNAGQTLALDAATGSWNLDGGSIVGGTVTGADGAGLALANLDTGTLDGVVLNADLTQGDRSRLIVLNGLELGGTLTLNTAQNSTSESFLTRLDFSGAQTLSGGGEVVFAGTAVQNRVRPTGHLTIGPGITLRGRAGVLGNTGQSFDNQGTVRAEVSGQTITLTGDAWTSSGTIETAGGGRLSLSGTATQAGTVTVDAAGVLTASAAYVQTAGSTTLQGGTFTASAGIDLSGGSFGGSGDVNGDLVNTGGTVQPGLSPGLLTLNGAFEQQLGGRLEIEIDGLSPVSEHDRLDVTGAVTLGGELAVVTGFSPAPGDAFDVMTWPAAPAGSFDSTDFGGGPAYAVNVGATALTLTVPSP